MTAIENQARSIFLAVLERASDEWPALLTEACGGNAELQARVEQLLHAHQAMGSIQLGGASVLDATIDPICERPGAVIGPYKLLEQIGEGGFGVVFMAEQHQPMRRKVALKLLKPGMDTRQVIARFEAERQALALMDHPNIAHVFDGGETASGRPYFVLELVRGISITEFCDQNHLPIHERLELFVTVCQAVQHAHQKGVIHRDLKPSNVMVTLHDNAPIVKVIDFGIAKAMGQQLTEKTLFTNFAQLIGTPVYMSPEQAQMSGLDMDTRTDVYSLGVLLYELLTGTTPFDKERLGTAAYDEMRRIIREEEPAKPSTRLSELSRPHAPREASVTRIVTSTLESISAQRRIEPANLTKLVRGELDWIVMKALEKDRNRRFESASAFAADVERYLNDQTVLACPPTLGYRLRKSMRRHKGPVLAAMLVALALVGGIIGTTWGLIRATYAEANAVTEANEKETALKDREVALSDAQDKLFLSLVNQARAERIGGRVGQRFGALKSIRDAAQIRMTSELRTEAIAALILPDVELAAEWEGWPEDSISLAFDADFERFARLDKRGGVTVCRLNNGQEEVITRLTAPGRSPPHAVWLSPDGRFVACGHSRLRVGVARGVRVWRLDERSPVVVLDVPEGVHLNALAFRPNGRQLAIGHANKAVSIYDLMTGECVQRFAEDSTVIHLAFHPSDSRVALALLNGRVEVFDAETGKKLQTPQVPSGDAVTWHPDGRRLAIAGDDRKIHLWDTETGAAVMAPWVGHRYDGVRVGFNHSGDRLLSVDWGGQTKLWDVANGRTLLTMPGSFGLQVSSDDRLIGHEVSGTKIRLWRLAGGQELRVLRGRNADSSDVIHNPVVHADGQTLAAATSQGLSFFELAMGEELASVRLREPYAYPVFFDPAKPSPTAGEPGAGDGSGGWMTGGFSGVLFWPARPDPVRQRVLHIGPPQQLVADSGSGYASGTSASSDSSVVAVPQGRSTTVLYRSRPDRRVVLGPQFDVRFAAVSPDGRLVVTSSHFEDHRSKSARIWNADTGEQVHELPLDGPTEAKFSPDGRWLMTITRGACRLWEVSTWHEVRDFDTSYGYFAFSPDSQILAISDVFNVIRLVETATGRELARLTGPEPMWYAPRCFAPDGTRLVATCSGQKALYVWDLRLIRQQLKQMGLDWDWPNFTPADSTAQRAGPIAIQVQFGDADLPVPTPEERAQHDMERYRRAIEANPESAADSNSLAWLYLAGPESLRDANAALPLAEAAVSLAGNARQLAAHRNTLGVAYYRAGRYLEAVQILRTNVASREDSGLSFDLFFLALSYEKLGESARARDYYDWAVRWAATERNLSAEQSNGLPAIRAEAKEVLGINGN
jgi:serine/threonine protein kinase/WD40 repeat protein